MSAREQGAASRQRLRVYHALTGAGIGYLFGTGRMPLWFFLAWIAAAVVTIALDLAPLIGPERSEGPFVAPPRRSTESVVEGPGCGHTDDNSCKSPLFLSPEPLRAPGADGGLDGEDAR